MSQVLNLAEVIKSDQSILEMFGEPIISGGQEAFVNNLTTNMGDDEIVIDLYTPYYCENKNYKQNDLNRNDQVFEVGLDHEIMFCL